MGRKLTTEEFIERAIRIHGNRYDYTEVVYVNKDTPVKVICTEHGMWTPTPNNHTRKKNPTGCPTCASEELSKVFADTSEQFIEKAIKVHGDVYDYSEVVYKNMHTEVRISCIEHNESWKQKPANHLLGKTGCKACEKIKIHEKSVKPQEQFIQEAVTIHGNKYNYDFVEYTMGDQYVKIWCNTCNKVFEMTPSAHINQKQGCSDCARREQGLRQRKTTEQFIIDARKVHGDKYIYMNSVYTRALDPITIECKEHGEFTLDRARDHLKQKVGCPICNKSTGENKVGKYLSQLGIKQEPQKKFAKCKYKRKLPFDFYLPEYNLCIEFHGRQHFEPIEFFGGMYGFVTCQIRDMIKKNYCVNSGIDYLMIPYWDYDKIELILENKLAQLSNIDLLVAM